MKQELQLRKKSRDLKTITAEQFVHAFREVVRENPNGYGDARHPKSNGCYYFNADGTPSCLIGHALAKCGVEPFEFDDFKNYMVIANYILDTLGVYDKTVRLAALTAQRVQDDGGSWKMAGSSFEHVLVTNGSIYA